MRLIPLKCPQCGAKLKVVEEDVLTLCQHCGLACELAGESVLKLEHYLVACQPQPDLRLPFWLLPCRAEATRMEARAVQSIFQSLPGIARPIVRAEKEALRLPSQVLVAAFRTTNFVNYTADLSYELTRQLPEVLSQEPVKNEVDYKACRYGHRDARGMAEVLLTLIANRNSPEIIALDFDIKWGKARLLWWPFVGDGDCWRDLIFGQRLLRSALM